MIQTTQHKKHNILKLYKKFQLDFVVIKSNIMDNHATVQAVLLNYMVYPGNYVFKNEKYKESKRECRGKK